MLMDGESGERGKEANNHSSHYLAATNKTVLDSARVDERFRGTVQERSTAGNFHRESTLFYTHPTVSFPLFQAVQLLYDADHFHYFFTDRDGTLKSYSCSYPSSIQPAYSGVIQVPSLFPSKLRP